MDGNIEWTTNKGVRNYKVEILEWSPEKVAFMDVSGSRRCKINMFPTDSGKLHSHYRVGSTNIDWSSFVGGMNEEEDAITGFWRREDGAYGGDGAFTLTKGEV